jgi:hypothetical protein
MFRKRSLCGSRRSQRVISATTAARQLQRQTERGSSNLSVPRRSWSLHPSIQQPFAENARTLTRQATTSGPM